MKDMGDYLVEVVDRGASYAERLRLHRERELDGAIESLLERGWSATEVRAVAALVVRVLRGRHPVAYGELTRVVVAQAANAKSLSATPEALELARGPGFKTRLTDLDKDRGLRRSLWVVGEAMTLGHPDLDAKLAELDGLQ